MKNADSLKTFEVRTIPMIFELKIRYKQTLEIQTKFEGAAGMRFGGMERNDQLPKGIKRSESKTNNLGILANKLGEARK